MTERLYRDDPYLLEFEARVVARTDHDGRPAVILDRTAFYPEAGGQPWDTGTLSGVAVVAALEKDGDVLHVLEAPLPADAVAGRVDGERRRDHRQQHHGQHLLSRALVKAAGARTLSFHLGADASTVDLDREVAEAQLRDAERLANEIVWAGHPVRVVEVSPSEARDRGVEPPRDAGDRVRLVEAEGFDIQPCGGTHPRSTSEVGVVLVLGRERYKSGSRVRFVCGHRALRAARERVVATDRLGALLSSPLPGLVEAAERQAAELAATQKRVVELRRQAIELEATRLLAGTPERPVVVAAFDGRPPEELRLLAQALVAARPCVALLASRAERVHLVFAQSDGLPHDVPSLLREAVARLGGKGGGRGNLAQGSGDTADGLDAALAFAAARVRNA
ncbi:MAG TPA: alanyl-tRNA editing protein [Vicinamibacteria bacterium]|nr:alanyl-tRNA editing protein [Vicinamibacteria bacterium]